ncbi:MAG: hypothetical protein ROZ09_15245 [Thiobacillus sp.]|jgi:hypothetical protein|uniref:hypothetical protein n=1 Tax=Thiobacillus sp. TaxID=924 RepID=UPI00289600B2|nr:hypothetical protein [Thiobacillus sp.]MDT3708176.1 hypothetical protein [Thiobacillus sp.]
MATWPTTLPSPEKDGYQITPMAQTIRTEMETGMPRVRRRSAARMDQVTVAWKFTDAQMQIFRTWFNSATDAAGGASWFTIDLAVGETGVEPVEARFSGEWTADMLAGINWRVSAKLEVR